MQDPHDTDQFDEDLDSVTEAYLGQFGAAWDDPDQIDTEE